MILLALDVDGTLDCSRGPVSTELMERLSTWAPGLVSVIVVSPSPAYQGSLERCDRGATREESLRQTAMQRPMPVRLYVSDNKDQEQAAAAGFCYIEATEFARGLN